MRGSPADPSAALDPVPARAPRFVAEGVALAAGWAAAFAALLPPVLAAEGGARGAAGLALGAALAFWGIAIAVVRSDLLHLTIPDGASLALAGLGLAVAAGTPWLAGDGAAGSARALLDAAATAAGAFALFWAVGAAFRAAGRDALGHGDVKLAGACAAWLSPADAALALEIAALGAIAALLCARRDGALRDTAVPFGAFLAPAAWLVLVMARPLRDFGLLPW